MPPEHRREQHYQEKASPAKERMERHPNNRYFIRWPWFVPEPLRSRQRLCGPWGYRLLRHKSALESTLFKRTKALFGLQAAITLCCVNFCSRP